MSLERVAAKIKTLMAETSKHFVDDVKLTFVVRHPQDIEGMIIISDDSLKDLVRDLKVYQERETKSTQ